MKFEQIIKDYDNDIRLCLRPLWNHSDYEDVKQEVLIRIYEKHSSITNPWGVKKWVRQVARNILIDYFRKSSSSSKPKTVQFSSLLPADQIDDQVIDLLFVDNNSPELLLVEKMEDRRFCRWIYKRVKLLPVYYRKILKDWYRRLTYKQIAKKNNIPIGTVRSRISRCIEHIVKVPYYE